MSRSPDSPVLQTRVDDLTHDGRGVARIDGLVYFIDYTLPGDVISFQPGRKRRSYRTGKLIEILQPAPDRVQAPCEYFGVCGGCALQHLRVGAQVDAKHRLLMDNLTRIGGVSPDIYFDPLTGDSWGYRRKARLGIRYVIKKGGVLVGFRERNKSYITQLHHCRVLHPGIAGLLPGLQKLVAGLSCYDQVPQIEAAAGDNTTALIFRHLAPLSARDREQLTGFAADNGIQIWLQSGGPDSVTPLAPADPEILYYALDDHGLKIEFAATDFVQVNGAMNQKLIAATLDYLDLDPRDAVLDLFCGVGNFTLPLARNARTVHGIEGESALVRRARHNADLNGIGNVTFDQGDLFAESPPVAGRYDKVLLDPPRSGAMEVIKALPAVDLKRLVYVSCNPATLARDAGFLVQDLGFRFTGAGVIDMFPHTTHVESIAVFEK